MGKLLIRILRSLFNTVASMRLGGMLTGFLSGLFSGRLISSYKLFGIAIVLFIVVKACS